MGLEGAVTVAEENRNERSIAPRNQVLNPVVVQVRHVDHSVVERALERIIHPRLKGAVAITEKNAHALVTVIRVYLIVTYNQIRLSISIKIVGYDRPWKKSGS